MIIAYYVMGLVVITGVTVFVHLVHRRSVRDRLKTKILEDQAREAEQINQVLDQLHRSDRQVISLLKSKEDNF
ncbi:MAG: hypothetical protein WDO15_11220 [Bacteroidota bacterium]